MKRIKEIWWYHRVRKSAVQKQIEYWTYFQMIFLHMLTIEFFNEFIFRQSALWWWVGISAIVLPLTVNKQYDLICEFEKEIGMIETEI